MKFFTSRLSWGILLIAGGVLFLLQNLKFLPETTSLWSIIFGAFGLYFLVIFLTSAEHWWSAFPAFGLLGLAGTITLAETRYVDDEWGGVFFLGMIGLSFFAIYFRNRDHWWPLIPGAVLLLVALPMGHAWLRYLWQHWQLLLVLIGALILIGAMRGGGESS